ncbi:MAG: protein-L-isoaspartate(D-aspartate) O-methyltransferase [Candidatus Sumerlaeia bacterium]|nr:protein-L-isoaspartate(D-aspartate) O-methyltransferase [Candidatus Sumerlaeia bacterium]
MRFFRRWQSNGSPDVAAMDREREFERQRHEMVDRQIARRGVQSPAVLNAMRAVPRHYFVPEYARDEAYADAPLPIGYDQTISQPYIVALMSELLGVGAGDRVLEIGTGSGYQTAILAEMGCEVFTIEIVRELARRAQDTLERLGYRNVHVFEGDGYGGLPEEAPFDGIILTAAPDHIPNALTDQLKVGKRLVLPLGRYEQDLYVIEKRSDGLDQRRVIPVRFVPMTGRAEFPP